MKTLITVFATIIATTIFLSSTSFAQEHDQFTKRNEHFQGTGGGAVKEGILLVDAFYGFPYINGALLESAYSSSTGNTNNAVHNLGHLGGKVEYMLSNKISLGIEFTYADATIRYQSNNLLYYTAGIRKYRILGKMSYHFATTEKLDPYFTWGAGYKNTTVYTNEPAATREVTINLVPVSLRVGLGLRYFFTDAFGINAEVGIGGPIMQAGLSLKF